MGEKDVGNPIWKRKIQRKIIKYGIKIRKHNVGFCYLG